MSLGSRHREDYVTVMKDPCDILISGGGVAGLTAAVAFGAAGFRVICADPTPPVTEREATGADLRTTAFLQPARDFLTDIGLWEQLAPFATPLDVMRIVDGTTGQPRILRDFRAAELSDQPFGWNLPNWLLRRELLARIADLPNVTFLSGIGTNSLLTRDQLAFVGLSDGQRLRSRLVLAADGRNSPMREAAGIGVTTTRFGQKALVFAVTHPEPHQNISTEIHRSGGPFTLVPLPDLDGRPCSAVVWMESGPKARQFSALEPSAFQEAATERSCGLYGPLQLASRISSWPIISQAADRLSGQRIALLAEAAHVMPPIGAQGLNMSLADLSCLRDLAVARPEGLGDEQMLTAYHNARFNDMRTRVAGINLLNRASQTGTRPMQDARAAGIGALYALPPVRHMLMRMGLGVR